jgi:predicted dienelactone hydrolase
MSIGAKFNSLLALFASLLLSIFGKSPPGPTAADLQRAEFKTSTQRLGIRFTERIRDIFRLKWLRKR